VRSLSPTDEASLRPIRQLEFHHTGSRLHEIDGLGLVFELVHGRTSDDGVGA
jgi:hypothetical protein